jgi:hypothetical protein
MLGKSISGCGSSWIRGVGLGGGWSGGESSDGGWDGLRMDEGCSERSYVSLCSTRLS